MIPKFRAWDKNNNRYINFDDERGYLILEIHDTSLWFAENGETNGYNTENIVLEQSTGLFDMNGKEIFEGDIVEYTLFHLNMVVTGFVVAKRGGYFMTDGHNVNVCLSDRPSQLIKIIGNIHEHRHLLEDN